MGTFIALFAVPLIYIWTHSTIYTNALTIVGPLVVMAIAMIEYQEISYALALAHGNTKINVIVGSAFIPLIAAATWLDKKFWAYWCSGSIHCGYDSPNVCLSIYGDKKIYM